MLIGVCRLLLWVRGIRYMKDMWYRMENVKFNSLVEKNCWISTWVMWYLKVIKSICKWEHACFEMLKDLLKKLADEQIPVLGSLGLGLVQKLFKDEQNSKCRVVILGLFLCLRIK